MKTKAILLISAVAIACGGQIGDVDGGGKDAATGDASGQCTTNAQCGQGICGFDQSLGCAATGKCFPQPGAVCNAYSPGCSCAGDTINLICNGLPSGFTTAPLAHTGDCTAPPPPPPDAGVAFPCGGGYCVPGQDICYIPMNTGTDPGTCMPANGCADCACAQAMFQCISTCKQNGPAIYVQCQ